MLSWLFPRPPLDIIEKAWVETRMLWLADTLGLPRMLEVPVAVPSREFFEGACDGTPDSARTLTTRLCDHMQLDPHQVHVEVCDDQRVHIAAGASETGIVRVAERQLADPEALAATIAHGLARSLLAHEDHDEPPAREQEWLTDLLPVYLGLGIFVANAVLREMAASLGHCTSCSMRHGYLPARMVGYALALFAAVRGERRPAWKSYLRLDALAAYTGGTRYVQRTADSLFTRETAATKQPIAGIDELLDRLQHGSPSARVATLWNLRSPDFAAAAPQVARCLHDRSPGVREEAIRTLACYGDAAHAALPVLIDLLQDRRHNLRSASAATLGQLAQDPELVLPPLAELLADPDREVIFCAATALGSFGPPAAPTLPAVLAALKTAMIRCDHALIDALTQSLYNIDTDPTDRVMAYFASDPELREQAVHIMVDALDK